MSIRRLLPLLLLILGCNDTMAAPETPLILRLDVPETLLATSDRVLVHLEGPVSLVRSGPSGDSLRFDNLPAGSYHIAVEAFAGDDVVGFGERSVEVAGGRTTEETLAVHTFVPQAQGTTEGDRVLLSWTAVEGATAYRIEASGLPDTEGFVHQGETQETVYETGPLPAGTYLFRVRAVNGLGSGGVAAEVSVTRRDYTLEIYAAPYAETYGRVFSDPPGVNCGEGLASGGGPCSVLYPEGTQVTLNLDWEYGTYQQRRTFGGWSGGGCAGFDACVVTMDGDKEVRATSTDEAAILEVDVEMDIPEGFKGRVHVLSDYGWVDCRREDDIDHAFEQCFYPFPYGLVVELYVEHTNEEGLERIAWEGCDESDDRICRIEIREGAPLSVKATAIYR